MIAGRLFVSDLDGTLLLPDKTLGARTRRALQRLRAAGGLYTVATGRSAASAAAILAGLDLPLPAITHNGALVSDLTGGHVTHAVTMDPATARRLFVAAAARGLGPVAYALAEGGGAGSAALPLLLHAGVLNEPTRRYVEALAPLHPVVRDVDGTRLAGLAPLSMIILDAAEPLAAFFAAECVAAAGVAWSLGRSAYTPALAVAELQAAAASKASAALRLAHAHGLDAAALVAFGDSDNDLPLLVVAGAAFCPPESSPAVLAAVRGRIPSAAAQGVAQHLEALLDGCDAGR